MKRIKEFWEFIKSTIGKWVLSLFGSIVLSLIMMFVCDCSVLQGFFASLSSGFVTGIILLLYSNHKEHCIKKCSQKAKDINYCIEKINDRLVMFDEIEKLNIEDAVKILNGLNNMIDGKFVNIIEMVVKDNKLKNIFIDNNNKCGFLLSHFENENSNLDKIKEILKDQHILLLKWYFNLSIIKNNEIKMENKFNSYIL